ncbi:MAG: BrnT family toxin [Pseudomonadota bacterium]
MHYAWDETKREENLRKHGVDFSDAVGALEDPASLSIEDPDAAGEARFLTLGRDFLSRVLLVVWTERAADRIRIISARKASPGETRRYHGA